MGKTQDLLEIHYEQMLVNYPNLLASELRSMPQGVIQTPQPGAYLRQAKLPSGGRIDLAFITRTVVHLVELKRDIVDEATLEQWRSYYAELRPKFPDHEFRGYLLGARCPGRDALLAAVGTAPVRVMLYRVDIPHWAAVRGCHGCGFGLTDEFVCPGCGRRV